MLDRLLTIAVFAIAVGSGLIGGIFFAFSTFIMRALSRQPARAGMAAMQAINVTVLNPLFLGVFLGTAGLSAFVIVGSVLRRDHPAGGWIIAGALLYLAGTFGVTVVGNMPLNNALAKVTPDDPDQPARWAAYIRTWTRWNHLRTIAALAAMVALVQALRAS